MKKLSDFGQILIDFGPQDPPKRPDLSSPIDPFLDPFLALVAIWGQDGPQIPPRAPLGPVLIDVL